MNLSMSEFCKRLSKALDRPIHIVWTSVVGAPGSQIPVLTVAGSLDFDRISFPERVQVYGNSIRFTSIGDGEIVVTARITLSSVSGPTIFVETLI